MEQDFNLAIDYLERMRRDRKIKLTHESASSQESLRRMNEVLEKMWQEFLIKESRSINAAKHLVINA